ncbi:MAG: hypothetical protein Q8O64_09220 [Sideroxyarcus sp.]|nr:hypothetical protein [Sideroxyarcus sp.]
MIPGGDKYIWLDWAVVGRPYSFINAPGKTPLEFYFIEVPGMGEMKKGTLTIYAVPKDGKEPYVFSVE